MRKISLIDATFREGIQSKLAPELIRVGRRYFKIAASMDIDQFEMGNPLVNPVNKRIYGMIQAQTPPIKIFLHTRPELESSLSLLNGKYSFISTFLPRSSGEKELKTMQIVLKKAEQVGTSVRLGIEDVGLISANKVRDLVLRFIKHKSVCRVALSDSSGILTPKNTILLVRKIMPVLRKKEIEFHLHNDFGLAAANCWAILNETSDSDVNLIFTVSIGGAGERNGILSYGDAFSLWEKLDTKNLHRSYKTEYYGDLRRLVFPGDKIFGRDPLGNTSFSHAAPSHILGILDKKGYQPINPTLFGATTQILITGVVGKTALRRLARKLWDIDLDNDECELIKSNLGKITRVETISLTELKSLTNMVHNKRYYRKMWR